MTDWRAGVVKVSEVVVLRIESKRESYRRDISHCSSLVKIAILTLPSAELVSAFVKVLSGPALSAAKKAEALPLDSPDSSTGGKKAQRIFCSLIELLSSFSTADH